MDFRFINPEGERLDYTYHPGAPGARDIVVIGHGVTGHKDRPFLVALANGLAAAGIPALRISFSGNAGSEGNFTDSNITKEVADLGCVIDALDAFNVTYAGHSMGGAVGVLRASQDSRIRRLISLAAIVHTRAFAERSFGHCRPGRDLMWDKPGCVLTQAYMEDMRQINSLVDHAGRISVPWLLVHGTEDKLVPIQDSRDAMAQARAASTAFVSLEGCDHIFEPGFTPTMVDAVVRWCQANPVQIDGL